MHKFLRCFNINSKKMLDQTENPKYPQTRPPSSLVITAQVGYNIMWWVPASLLAPPRRHPHSVHGQRELGAAGPRSPRPQHQQEVAVDVLEGDLGPHPGAQVGALLLDSHLAWLAPVGPRQHSQLVRTSVCSNTSIISKLAAEKET